MSIKGGCGNPKCGVSNVGLALTTFGRGELDDYGYWQYPCSACARAFEKLHPKHGSCWPPPAIKNFNRRPPKAISRIGSEVLLTDVYILRTQMTEKELRTSSTHSARQELQRRERLENE